ncbi:MAG: GreA/GreB family elongation factor [Phycisphaerae bacterium]
MPYDQLRTLAKTKRWDELESEWLSIVARPDLAPDELLPVIDTVVESGRDALAETMGWAWLSSMKENHTAREALQLGRGLLLRLPDGEELREEILSLYKETHTDHPDLETWVDRSGLQSGKSVRRALRYLDVGLRLAEGAYLIHRTEDRAARIEQADIAGDEITLKHARGTEVRSLAQIIDDYDLADENDFFVLQQLNHDRIEQLLTEDPIKFVIGILRCHQNRIDRDALKLMLVPRYVAGGKWSDWWSKIRNGVKKSPHLRIEGRSPMFLIYDPVGRTLEDETWPVFSQSTTPRQWLEVLDGYLRDAKYRKTNPDPAFLDRIQKGLVAHIERFKLHSEASEAFATALVIERLAADGLSISADAHGTAVEMLRTAVDPVAMVASVPDTRLWSLGIACVEQAFPEKWPEFFAELILYSPGGQCDPMARRVEKAGQGELLASTARRAVADPGRFTDAMMWLWKGADVKVTLPIPTALEMFTLILDLVGPARVSAGKAAGQTVNEMRSKVRSGLSAKGCAPFRACVKSIDLSLAQAIRRQIERAEGLGPSVQSELLNILSELFPMLYVKAEVPIWEDESVLYFTEASLRAKQIERDELVNVKMRDNARAIGEAAEHGDLSENSEYKFALEERDLLRGRLAQINGELDIAKILDPSDIPTDHVTIGQRITLRPTTGGEPIALVISGVGDSDISRKIFAYKTPIAMRLLGKKPNESVRIAFDGNNEVEYQVEGIERAVE